MSMPATQAMAIMEEWQKFDAIDVLLSRISRTYKHKSAAVKQWTADLIENRIWRGSNTTRTRVRVTNKNKKQSPRRKQKRSSATQPSPVKVWTKEEREEATRKKADEPDVAAANGVRRSRRARVPTEKVLNGQEW